MPLWSRLSDILSQDLRYGARMLWARPGFAAVAVLSLALGIGAVTAIFSVVYAVLVDPYPYRAPERIGQIVVSNKNDRWRGIGYSKAQYLDLKTRLHAMEDAVAVDMGQAVLTGNGLAEVVDREQCSPNFFDFFGVPPLFGRAFSAKTMPSNAAPEPVAVISYKFWQHAFAGSRDVLGRKIRLNDDFYTVIGVLPVRFTWNDIDVYVPMNMRPSSQEFINVFYRVRSGVSQDRIRSEMQPLLAEYRRQVPRYMYPEGAFTLKFVNVNEGILGKFQTTLLVLFGAVTLLLLIACVNVANLLLARAATREGEMAVRVSVGATGGRLAAQLLTESVLLALTGGLCGVAFAYGGVKTVVALMPEYSIPHEAVIALNWPVLWFALAASLCTGILFGLAPALQAGRASQASALRRVGRGTSSGTSGRRLHSLLLITEVALSLILLSGAGLAIRGLFSLERKSLGYNPRHALTFRLPLTEGHYTKWAERLALYQNVSRRLARHPRIEAVSMSGMGTPPYNGMRTKISLDDRAPSQAPEVQLNLVQNGYFQAVGTRLLRGRDLTESDVLSGRPVAVVSEDFARREYGAGRDPIGHRFSVDLFTQPIPPAYLKSPNFNNSFEIVGVVGSARNRGLNEPAEPAAFLPYSILLPPDVFVIARTAGDPNTVLGFARDSVRAVDRNQPITSARTLEEWLNTATAYQSFATFLFSVFGAIGLSLAAAGVFSVVSYAVAQRTREFGIRMALGAEPRQVLRLVLLATGKVLGVGVVLGVFASLVLSRVLAERMQGMGTPDALTFVLVPLALVLATLVACFLPARSATRVEPVEALRHD